MQKKNFYKEQATAYYRKLGMDAHKYVEISLSLRARAYV